MVSVCADVCEKRRKEGRNKRATGVLDGDAAPLGVVRALRVLRHRQRGQLLAGVRNHHACGTPCVRRVHNIKARRQGSMRALHSIEPRSQQTAKENKERKKEKGFHVKGQKDWCARGYGMVLLCFLFVFFVSERTCCKGWHRQRQERVWTRRRCADRWARSACGPSTTLTSAPRSDTASLAASTWRARRKGLLKLLLSLARVCSRIEM